ncbi:dual specificity protein kinase yak1 [Tulasnella sp. 427]|nr:dual specificity protein kinase yak1 [Tulasnella sp. 427]
MYNQESAGVARGHQRISSLLGGEQSPTVGGDSSSIQRSGSLSSSFYPSAVGGAYRQDNSGQQLHPYQNTDAYPPQEYNGSYTPRRANTQAGAKGVTLSPRSSLRHPPPTSPSMSVKMEQAHTGYSYSQQPQDHPAATYGPPSGGAPTDLYTPTSATGGPGSASAPYHPANHSNAASPSPSANTHNFSPAYGSQQPSAYPPPHQAQQQLPPPPPPQSAQDAYSNHPQYAPQQHPPELARASSSGVPHPSIRGSTSTPNTPLSHRTYQQQSLYPASQQPVGYYGPPSTEPPPQNRRTDGLRRVRDQRDLRPMISGQPAGRRADPNGTGFLSPLKSLTTHITSTYSICNPSFRYETAHNPRRVLTKPSKPVHNEGFDNEDYDYILYVNDWLGQEDGHNKYLILDILGQGTFGQVVKCQNMKTHEIVAVKVVKNKPAYFNQSMMEVQILRMLNEECDASDEHHILRLRETFIHKSHLCLVFELLSSNLYELIKQNQFGGLSTQLVKVFTSQLLDALTVLKEAQLIHCDLKPENILLKSLQSPTIKVIDFGSACHERQTVYTYIQSRFYRSPEVLLGLSYTSAIDMWSLGCIAVELFLGLPLFPGTSEYNQITRIVEMLGLPPTWMLEKGNHAKNFFAYHNDEYGNRQYRLKSLEQYSREHGTNEQPGKKYFSHNTLPDIIRAAPMQKSSSKSPAEIEKENLNRTSFIDFVSGLLNLNPFERWTPQQARMHPFITGDKWTKPFVPPGTTVANGRSPSVGMSSAESSSGTLVNHSPAPSDSSNKRPYGGLLPQPQKGNRPYQDATSYNQRLAQHQAHLNQQAVQAAANQGSRNPYVSNQSTGTMSQGGYSYSQGAVNGVGPPPPVQYNGQQTGQQPRLQPMNTNLPPSYPLGSGTHSANPQQHYPNPPSSSYNPNRARANTINQMDQVPPQLARIHLDLEAAGMGRNMTPVLNREDPTREWERRQAGGGNLGSGPAYPQLEYLQQQVEQSGGRWDSAYRTGGTGAHRYAPAQPSSLQFQAPAAAVVVDSQDKNPGLRESAMSSARTAAGLTNRFDTGGPAPPQPAYSGQAHMVRYGAGPNPPPSTYGSQQPQSTQQPAPPPAAAFDAFDHRDGLATLYAPMQPNQYGAYAGPNSAQSNPTGPPSGPGSAGMGGAQSQGTPSFYSAGVMAAGGPGPASAYGGGAGQQQQQQQGGATKDGRRMSGMDVWSRS